MHTGASAVTTIIKDKFMSKSMGREALSALKLTCSNRESL